MFSAQSKPVAWPLFFFYFFFCCLVGVMMPYIGVYYKSIGITASEIGRLMSTFTLSGILVPHVWGWLTTKTGLPKRLLQCAIFGCLLAIIPLNWTKEFNRLWGLTCLMALTYSALIPMTDALTVRSIKYLDVPYSKIRVGGSIGYVLAVASTGLLIGWFGPSVVVPVMCFYGFLAVLITWKIKEQAYEKVVHTESISFFSLLITKESLLFFGIAFLSYMSHAPFNIFFAIHLTNLGYSGESIGLFIALGVVIEVLLFLFFGNTIKQFHILHLVILCFVCGIIRWLLVGWFADIVWVLLFTQLLHCITFALFHIVSIEKVKGLFPERYASQGQAMYSALAIGLGGGLGMVGAGYLWEWIGGAWVFTMAALVSASALILLLYSQYRH